MNDPVFTLIVFIRCCYIANYLPITLQLLIKIINENKVTVAIATDSSHNMIVIIHNRVAAWIG